MTLSYANWPFLPKERRTPEQNEDWWATCYYPSTADVVLRGTTYSVVVMGGCGTGKSIALEAFTRAERETYFIVRYPVERWPGEVHAWNKIDSHLEQIMICVTHALRHYLSEHNIKLQNLSKMDLQYLCWLIDKYNGSRLLQRWVNSLKQTIDLSGILSQGYQDIFQDDVTLQAIQEQLEELVVLSHQLEFKGVVILIDVHNFESRALTPQKVMDLFSWLKPLQIDGFALKVALPQEIVEQTDLINLSRGRVKFSKLTWSIEDCRTLSENHLRTATEDKLKSLSELATAALLTALETKIGLAYTEAHPTTWLQLTYMLLQTYAKNEKILTKEAYLTQLVQTYFSRHIPLQIDFEESGVWRGDEFIKLDDQPFRFLVTLWHNRKSTDSNLALLDIAGSQGNLNTLASRLRKKIEPIPQSPVYLHNSRGQGYWLENTKKYVKL